jgi:serine/threonine protein kinase
VDGRSEILSLGVVMYGMFTGEKPFPSQSITTVISKILSEDPVPLRRLNPSLHPGLNEIVLRALAKEPEERYQLCRGIAERSAQLCALGAAGQDNPDATLISPRTLPGQPFSTPTTPLRTPYFEGSKVAAGAHSLQSRGAIPSHAPEVRRTGPLPPVSDPERSPRTFATVLAAVFCFV